MTAIPASIPPPQAVVEIINSHCPPGFSVSSVGASVSLYRGAGKSPLAAFSYTGLDSVIGITVAIWRIALAEKAQPVTNITNVSNTNATDIEEMKARGDALQILGWPGGCDPTAWARSYLNIEAMTLADERERAEKAESDLRISETVRSSMAADLEQIWAAFTVAEGKDEPAPASSIAEFILAQEGTKEAMKAAMKAALAAEDKERARAEQAEMRVRVLQSEATALRDSEQRAVDASIEARKRNAEIEQAIDSREARISNLLAGLWKLGYHPDMELDEWAAARVKQRDDLEQEAKVLAEVKRMVLASGRSMNNLSLPQVMSEILADAAASSECMARAERSERELADLQRLLAGLTAPRVAEPPEDLLTLGPRLRAMGPALRKLRLDHAVQITDLARATDANVPMLAAIELGLEPLWDRMLDASEAKRLLGYAPKGSDLEAAARNTLLRDEVSEIKRALTAESETAALRKEALVTLGWGGTGDPKAWAEGQAARSRTGGNDVHGRLADSLARERDLREQMTTESETLAQIRGALLEALGLAEQGTTRPIIELIAELVEARDKARETFDQQTAHAGRWRRICTVLGGNPDAEPPPDLAGFIDPAGPGQLMQDFARVEWKGLTLSDVLADAMRRVPPSEIEAAVVSARNHLRRGHASSAAAVLERAAKLEIKPPVATAQNTATATRLEDGRVRIDFPTPVHEAETKAAAEYFAGKGHAVDKEAPHEPSPRTRWQTFVDAAVALGLNAHVGPDGGVVVASPGRFAKPATIGVRFALDPGEGVDVTHILNTPIKPSRVVGVNHATGESVTCMRVSLPGGTKVRYLIHDGKDWAEAPARAEQPKKQAKMPHSVYSSRLANFWRQSAAMVHTDGAAAAEAWLAKRLEWLRKHDVQPKTDGERDVEAGITAADSEAEKTAGFTIGSKETVGPRWTGITWMSSKGRAKTCRIEGLHIQGRRTAVVVDKPEPDQIVIKVPTSPWNLPAKLVCRIHGKKTLSFHIGGGKVITGTVAKVDASAISSMLLYVAT